MARKRVKRPNIFFHLVESTQRITPFSIWRTKQISSRLKRGKKEPSSRAARKNAQRNGLCENGANKRSESGTGLTRKRRVRAKRGSNKIKNGSFDSRKGAADGGRRAGGKKGKNPTHPPGRPLSRASSACPGQIEDPSRPLYYQTARVLSRCHDYGMQTVQIERKYLKKKILFICSEVPFGNDPTLLRFFCFNYVLSLDILIIAYNGLLNV